MKSFVIRALAAAGALAAGAAGGLAAPSANEPALTAGVESTVSLSATGAALKIYLPSNYNADRKWPAIFFYHGLGGTPDTALMRGFTGGRDYVVVGLPYVSNDEGPRTAQQQTAALRDELAGFHRARSWLCAHASIDDSRVFLAGASKGGWMAGSLGELELPQLGGMIILLAGRQSTHALAPAVVQGRPIYIGAGETDPNLLPARRAREFYKRNGAVVTFEEYAGHGHEVPADADRLRLWLSVHGHYSQDPMAQAPQKEVKAAMADLFKAALAETNVLARYDQFLALSEDPRLRLCEPALLQQMRTQFATLVQTPPAKEEWTAESAFNELLYREACIQRLADMQAVLDGYRSLVKNDPQTRAGKLAAQYVPRLEEAYEKSVEATRNANQAPPPKATTGAVQPSFPMSGPDGEYRPMPVRKGNKISFGNP